jgi:protein-histidine pros-kinase
VPESLAIKIADQEAKTLMISLALIALATLAVLDLLLYLTVIRPVLRLSRMADEISRGNMEVDELTVTGRDEISTLAESFNRMHRSLVRAMQMLSQDPEA